MGCNWTPSILESPEKQVLEKQNIYTQREQCILKGIFTGVVGLAERGASNHKTEHFSCL